MTTRVHMQDQVKDRINIIMQDNGHITDDCAQTVVMVLIVFVFLTFGLSW
jgi:hypothetical protein